MSKSTRQQQLKQQKKTQKRYSGHHSKKPKIRQVRRDNTFLDLGLNALTTLAAIGALTNTRKAQHRNLKEDNNEQLNNQ